jgi:hypothetical protein
MVEISKSGSGEGPGRVTASGYSTRPLAFCPRALNPAASRRSRARRISAPTFIAIPGIRTVKIRLCELPVRTPAVHDRLGHQRRKSTTNGPAIVASTLATA